MVRIKPFWARLWLALSLLLAVAIISMSLPFNRIATIIEAVDEIDAPGIPAVECSRTSITISLEDQDGTKTHFCFSSHVKINQFIGQYSRAQKVANTKKSLTHLAGVALKIFGAMLILAFLGFLADWVARGAQRGFLYTSTDSQLVSAPLTGIGVSQNLKVFLRSAWKLAALTLVITLSYTVFLDMTWVYKALSAFGDKPLSGFMLALPLLVIFKRGAHWFQAICAYPVFAVPAVLVWYPIGKLMGDFGLVLYAGLSIVFIELARYVSPQLRIGTGRFSSRWWQLALVVPTIFACSLLIALVDYYLILF